MGSDSNIRFYHGVLSREAAESLLIETGEEGTFLVRDSNTSSGDYVLSVLVNGEVIHYQIRKHDNDALFSIDEQVTCHGLETLIEYYQGTNRGLIAPLGQPIIKDPPPHDTWCHGRENLLHRATKQGQLKIVRDLLNYGYRKVDAKNQDGQTAVHLACQLSETAILQALIAAKANVNCRDTEGNTPLHYACHRNSASTIRVLVEEGMAQVQMRNIKSDWVPLHEAASRGYIDCVVALLSLDAPLRPRTNKNELPVDLARMNGHQECAEILANYPSRLPKTGKLEWYHGTLGRNQAVEILQRQSNCTDGSFLVRSSERKGLVITMLYLEQYYHFQIRKVENLYCIDDGPYLDSLEGLIEYYMTMVDGLPCKLQVPVAPEPSPPLPTSPHPATLPRPTRRSYRREVETDVDDSSSNRVHNASTLPHPARQNGLPEISEIITIETVQSPHYDGCIPSDNVILREVIGEGEFGSVHRGILQNRQGYEEEVAVKTVRADVTNPNRDEFLAEANVMMKLDHECIVRFIGICTEPNLLMVQELMPLGSMLGYLLKYPIQVSPTYELKIWASQIARGYLLHGTRLWRAYDICVFTAPSIFLHSSDVKGADLPRSGPALKLRQIENYGMRYLEEQRFVHRDLAARNILLATKYQAKITDFGLSRTLSCNQDYYRASQGGRWPIKWYAPESFNFGTFTSASDVWSFGVTLWEMYSYGEQPYGSLKGAEVIDLVERGERLPQPWRCPKEVYDIMYSCWAFNCRNRPTFTELTDMFTCPEYSNIQELLD